MRVCLYNEYGALNSQEVFNAFRQGLALNGDTEVKSFEEADVVVIWSILFVGRMAPNNEIWVRAKKENKPVVVLEVGALKRGVTWKVGINGINRKATFVQPFEENRFEKLNLRLSPWKEDRKGAITIFTQRPDSEQWKGMYAVETYVQNLHKEVRKYSNRKIIVRPHPRDRITDWNLLSGLGMNFSIPKPIGVDMFDHDDIFEKTYCAINYSSGPSIQAVMAGIHTLCSQDSLAFDVSEKIENIETPLNKDRTDWCNMIAHTEWTVDEIKKGIPWCHLKKSLSTN